MSHAFQPELWKMVLEELQGNGLCQSPASVFFLPPSLAFAIEDGTVILTSQCKLANEPSGPDTKSAILVKKYYFGDF
jgi:hypothetical protein